MGRASIGQVNVAIADVRQTPGDQDTGYVTGKLADASATPAVVGRRARLRRFIDPTLGWITLADGPITAVRMRPSYAGFEITIRDTRDQERKHKAFQQGSTTSVLPRGVIGGFGGHVFGHIVATGFPDGIMVKPDVLHTPLSGPFRYDQDGNGYVDLRSYITGFLTVDPNLTASPDPSVVVVPATREAMLGQPDFERSTFGITLVSIGQGLFKSGLIVFRFPKVHVWWRRVGETAWSVIRPARQVYQHDDVYEQGVHVCDIFEHGDLNGYEDSIPFAYRVYLSPNNAYLQRRGVTPGSPQPGSGLYPWSPALPDEGDDVEVIVQYVGRPTPKLPFHFTGTRGGFLKHAYDGAFSPKAPATIPTTDDVPAYVTVPTGIRYDAAVLAAMTEPVLARITEPADDLRSWLEKYLYAPSGSAPTIDHDGIMQASQVEDDRRIQALHEGGHAVLAVLEGCRIEFARIRRPGEEGFVPDDRRAVLFGTVRTVPTVPITREQHSWIALAGYAAEQEAGAEQLTDGAAREYAETVRELAARTSAPEAAAAALVTEARRRLRTRWLEVEAVAAALLAAPDGVLAGASVEHIVRSFREAMHESGHATFAYANGVRIVQVVLRAGGGPYVRHDGNSRDLFGYVQTEGAPALGVDFADRLLLAGFAAEAEAGALGDDFTLGAIAEIKRVADSLTARSGTDGWPRCIEIMYEVRAFLRARWPAVRALADELMRRAPDPVPGEEVAAILEAALGVPV